MINISGIKLDALSARPLEHKGSFPEVPESSSTFAFILAPNKPFDGMFVLYADVDGRINDVLDKRNRRTTVAYAHYGNVARSISTSF